MSSVVNQYVRDCRPCRLAKKHRTKRAGLLKPIKAAEVLAQVSMDLLDASVTTPRGNRYVIVLTDAASGYVMAVPVKDKSADEAVRAFDCWRAVFRCPHTLITDNGTNFVKGNLPQLLSTGAVRLKTSLPYRAQGNGRAERAVQVVRNLVTANSIDGDRPWDQILPEVVSAYNASKHTSTQFSPHFLLFGVQPEMAVQAEDGSHHMQVAELPPTPEDRAELLEWFRAIAKGNVVKAQARQKIYFDKRRQVRRFEPGAIVKLLKHPQQMAKQGKFGAPFIGPLVIDSCERDDIYRLRNMDGKRLKGRSVNVERIYPYYQGQDVRIEAPGASDLVADGPEQTVPRHAPPPSTRPDNDDDDDASIVGGNLGLAVAPRRAPPSGREGPTIGPNAEQVGTSELVQRSDTQDSATELASERETVVEQQPLPEATVEPDIPLDMGFEPTVPMEPEPSHQMSADRHEPIATAPPPRQQPHRACKSSVKLPERQQQTHKRKPSAEPLAPTVESPGPSAEPQELRRSKRIRRPPAKYLDQVFALIGWKPWKGRSGGRSSVMAVN